ncbi:hypothetical protein [Rhizobium leguminosarum]|uniref:hypothetical protein n=1 Tax=Rhizobium leguminosarum TaxID=384 RepID=UPI000F7B1939|nr:hypothetical protein [Rhizobium leguminosarum]
MLMPGMVSSIIFCVVSNALATSDEAEGPDRLCARRAMILNLRSFSPKIESDRQGGASTVPAWENGYS